MRVSDITAVGRFSGSPVILPVIIDSRGHYEKIILVIFVGGRMPDFCPDERMLMAMDT